VAGWGDVMGSRKGPGVRAHSPRAAEWWGWGGPEGSAASFSAARWRGGGVGGSGQRRRLPPGHRVAGWQSGGGPGGRTASPPAAKWGGKEAAPWRGVGAPVGRATSLPAAAWQIGGRPWWNVASIPAAAWRGGAVREVRGGRPPPSRAPGGGVEGSVGLGSLFSGRRVAGWRRGWLPGGRAAPPGRRVAGLGGSGKMARQNMRLD